MEKWKVINEFPVYAVSDQGRIKRIVGGRGAKIDYILKPFKQNDGYLLIDLRKNNKRFTKLVHHLVLETFIGPRLKGMECNHKDGIKTNNRSTNLEWVTGSENIRHAYKIGLKNHKGEKHPSNKLTWKDVDLIRSFKGKLTQIKIALLFNIHQSQVSNIFNNKYWRF